MMMVLRMDMVVTAFHISPRILPSIRSSSSSSTTRITKTATRSSIAYRDGYFLNRIVTDDDDNSIQLHHPLYMTSSSSPPPPASAEDNNKKKKRRKKKKRSKSTTTTTTTDNPNALQTWRFYGVSVSPDALVGQELYLNHIPRRNRTRRRTISTTGSAAVTVSDVEKMYLSQPVLDALLVRIKYAKSNISGNDGGATSSTPTPTDEYTFDEGVATPKLTFPKGIHDVRVLRRSLDARKRRRYHGGSGDGDDAPEGPQYSHIVDVDLTGKLVQSLRLRNQSGRTERMVVPPAEEHVSVSSNDDIANDGNDNDDCEEMDGDTTITNTAKKPRVVIVGAGPAGLFAALTLARSGTCTPILLERGQPVEARGKDIGALIHRRRMNRESNFAFGEGGAGTWSDGKLTTRIGRNSASVRKVLETFVEYGAPEKILVDGSPHLGTDNLQVLLRNMRLDLRKAGVEIRFGARVSKFHFDPQTNRATGVTTAYSPVYERNSTGWNDDPALNLLRQKEQLDENTDTIEADAIVLATGHSARDVYEDLHASGVELEAKGFATGFRIEHPQKIINKIRYGEEWGPSTYSGRLATDSANKAFFPRANGDGDSDGDRSLARTTTNHEGKLPVPSYRLATNSANDGTSSPRDVYSFCMCPGGQVVPASTEPNEVCVNGMSFSKRDSLWANSGLVVSVSPDDPILDTYKEKYGVLAGIEFQKSMERRAAEMGGGNFTVPVQRLTDFIDGVASTSAPPSSYRLGVKPSACHEIYPDSIVASIRDAVVNQFERQMPGYLCEDALLHGVETRTSSPVRVCRDSETLQAIGRKGLYPCGEGAGFAGGIVSAAVDGMVVAESVLEELLGVGVDDGDAKDDDDSKKGKKKREKSVGFTY